jgi:predicted HicB family RNase H-like nuclease
LIEGLSAMAKKSIKTKKITLLLNKLLYEKIEGEAHKKESSKSQFIAKIISEYLGLKYTYIKKKQSNNNSIDLTNRGEILSLSLTLSEFLHSKVKEKAEEEKLSILQFIHKIITKHLGFPYGQAEMKNDQPPNPHKKCHKKGKLLTVYL